MRLRELIPLSLPQTSATGVKNPVNFETRLRYNQSFESIVAEVPNTIMLLLMLIPAVMATVGVVKEKETGSIANFYSTPIAINYVNPNDDPRNATPTAK